MERKWFSVLFQIINPNKPSVRHVMMIWTKSDKVLKIIASALLSRNEVVDRSNVRKSTNNTLSTISDSRRHFSTATNVRFSPPFQSSPMTFPRTFLRAKTKPFSFKHGRSHQNRSPANFAWVLFAVVKRVVCSSSRLPEIITTFT